jgi:hypothetical protein
MGCDNCEQHPNNEEWWEGEEYVLTPDYSNGDPPPAISATTTEVIDFSIEFGFAILNYVPL